MSLTTWDELVEYLDADTTAVANSTSETSVWDVTVYAKYMQRNRTLHMWVMGKYSTTGTPTMTFRLRWGGSGGVLLAASAAVTTPSGVTNAMWKVDISITTRLNGVTGTMMANGELCVFAAVAPTVASATGAAAVTPMTAGGVTAPAVATTDITIDKVLSLTQQWSAASASNTMLANNGELRSVN